jgi:ribosome maturation protein SDO1
MGYQFKGGLQGGTRETIHFNVARLKKGGHNFEVVLEDIDKAIEVKHGKELDMRQVINGDKVFKDADKGEIAAGTLMKQWFETDDTFEVAKIIIQKGEINLNSEQRNRIFENRKKKIVEYIHANAFDPKTRLPHPLQRIELAMKEAKVSIDPYDKFDFQIKQVISKHTNKIRGLCLQRGKNKVRA